MFFNYKVFSPSPHLFFTLLGRCGETSPSSRSSLPLSCEVLPSNDATGVLSDERRSHKSVHTSLLKILYIKKSTVSTRFLLTG